MQYVTQYNTFSCSKFPIYLICKEFLILIFVYIMLMLFFNIKYIYENSMLMIEKQSIKKNKAILQSCNIKQIISISIHIQKDT